MMANQNDKVPNRPQIDGVPFQDVEEVFEELTRNDPKLAAMVEEARRTAPWRKPGDGHGG